MTDEQPNQEKDEQTHIADDNIEFSFHDTVGALMWVSLR